MPETDQLNQKDVSVEDLLKLKRAEQPSEAFWSDFDSQLHRRMLNTLVKKDPWYVQLMRGLTGRVAQSVTLVGAAAAFAFVAIIQPTYMTQGNSAGEGPVLSAVGANVGAEADVVNFVESDASGAIDLAASATELDELQRDYLVEEVSVVRLAASDHYQHDFGMASLQVEEFDTAAYSAEDIRARSLPKAGMANLMF